MNQEYQQTVADFNAYLGKMSQAVEHFCEDLAESDYAQISMVLPSIVEGLGWINDAVSSFVKLGVLSVEQHASFQTLVGNLTDSLENKDYVLLHDLFSYEMLPLLATLKIDTLKN